MRSFATVLAPGLLAAPAAAGFIKPALEALTWKFNGQDFWAPVHLDSAVYHAQSPAGVIGASLAKRATPTGPLGCTALTVPDTAQSLSSAVVQEALAKYHDDDVWSAEQFLDCILVQYNGTGSGVGIDTSLGNFISEHGITTAYFDVAFDLNGLVTAANVFSLVTNCEISNGPIVVAHSECESGTMSVTPVYALRSDNYDGKKPPRLGSSYCKSSVSNFISQLSCMAHTQTQLRPRNINNSMFPCLVLTCQTSLFLQGSHR